MTDFAIESTHHTNAPAPPKRPGARHQEASPDASPTLLTLAHAARLLREAVKGKSYRAFPLGQEAGHYLRAKRKRLTAESYRDYESCLDKLARYFADLELGDFEPPVGTERLEEFLDFQWGERTGRTYNKNLSILRDFFKFHVLRKRLHGDPTLPIERAKKRGVHRTTFSPDERNAILASNPARRDKIALRLLLDFGLRKGALQKVQFKHFDHHRKRLTIFTKGGKIRELPIPQSSFWFDLERLILEDAAQPHHHLLPRQKAIPRKGQMAMHRFHEQPTDGRPWHARLVVRVPTTGGRRGAGRYRGRADAQGPAYRRSARARRNRKPQCGPEASGA